MLLSCVCSDALPPAPPAAVAPEEAEAKSNENDMKFIGVCRRCSRLSLCIRCLYSGALELPCVMWLQCACAGEVLELLEESKVKGAAARARQAQ